MRPVIPERRYRCQSIATLIQQQLSLIPELKALNQAILYGLSFNVADNVFEIAYQHIDVFCGSGMCAVFVKRNLEH